MKWLTRMLMNEAGADEGSGGGADDGAGDANAPPPKEPTLSEVNARLEKMMSGMEQIGGAVRQQGQYLAAMEEERRKPRAKPAEETQEEDEYEDPVAKQIKAQVSSTATELAGLQDQMDMTRFSQYAAQAGLDEKEVEEILAVHTNWAKQGLTIDGKRPWSRVDVGNWVQGRKGFATRVGKKAKAGAVEDEIDDANEDAHTEAPGRVLPGKSRRTIPNYEETTRQDRMKNGGEYWSKKLDAEPW